MGQLDPFGLAHQAEPIPISGKAPLAAATHQLQSCFASAEQQLLAQSTVLASIHNPASCIAQHLGAHNPHHLACQKAFGEGVWFEVF